MRPHRPVLAAVLVLALLGGCTAGADEPAPSPAKADLQTKVPAELEEYYGQEVAWEECGSNLECADVTVPLDYDTPDGEDITIAVKRLHSSRNGQRVGSLLINPGGPGSSGTSLVDSATAMFSEDLRAAYDVVGFDPRGTGDSTRVDCVSDFELDRIRGAQYEPETTAGLEAYEADTDLIAEGCVANSGDLVTEVDTASAARDMDILRHLLGEPELDYLGYSYGTYLGATYAELFPGNVGRLVLDGAMDPSLGSHETVLGQARGFEQALRAYVEDCLGGEACPLGGSVDDGVAQVQTLLQVTQDTPLPTADGRELTAPLAFSGMITPLYESRTWFFLSQALDQAMNDGDGSLLLYLADLMAGRAEDGTYPDGSTEANWAINCADFGSTGDPETWARQAEDLREVSPTFGDMLAYGDLLCADWPGVPAGSRGPLTAAGAAPIMVVGTTGDPATPYEWGVALADQLESGFLVTYDGEGHTAYGRSNECVTAAVDGFLIDGVKPEDGLVC
ncbi:alpha/beta hydrolase [Georgenia yuyongxinii]|uniref:Alpha/beta hydrolase n=1 Tax=Georgenia yuyongxinii TaxID=2589797 RepID=A0A552WL19_9MICO|nr:alpha/beta hydrolase [Georgenia yuyongxinii]TRW43471.1 alpha/beta hydrolase [Georgenia yuyongxinii]